MTKKYNLLLTTILLMLLAGAGYSARAYARETLTSATAENSQFMRALQHIDALAAPEEDAEVVFSYEADAVVFVTGETEDGWYIVSYQGKTGYIPKSLQDAETASDEDSGEAEVEAEDGAEKEQAQEQGVGAALAVETIDVDALNAEFEEQGAESEIVVEMVEKYRSDTRRSRIWGVLIAALIIAIFAVGIISTVRAEKAEKAHKKEAPDGAQEPPLDGGETRNAAIPEAVKDMEIIDLDEDSSAP